MNNELKYDYEFDKKLNNAKQKYLNKLKNQRNNLDNFLLTLLFGFFLISYTIKIDYVIFYLAILDIIVNNCSYYLTNKRISNPDFGYNSKESRELIKIIIDDK